MNYEQAEYAEKSEYVGRDIEPSNQVPQALKQLEEAVMVLNKQSDRILESASRAMQPEETAVDPSARLDSVPRMPVAPLAQQIDSLAERVRRISAELASGADRMQL